MSAGISRFVEAHSRALLLVALSFALAGAVLLFRLPISIFPQTDFPRISIRVDNGIAPVDVEMLTVTRPIEEAIRVVPGLSNMRSVTSRGSTEINIYFQWDIDILNAQHLVQGQIAQIASSLPQGAVYTVKRLTFSVFPIIGFSLTSPSRSTSELWDLAYYNLAPRLYRQHGVAEAQIVGGQPMEYHVLLNPERLNSYGIPQTKVSDAIRNNNLLASAGMVEENYHLYLTTVSGLARDRSELEAIVVAVINGTPVLVKDVARVVTAERPVYQIVTANGRPAVLVNILQQPDGNTVEIAEAVNKELRDIRRMLPKDIELATFYDQSVLVRDSISGVVESILIGLALSIAVLIGFLKDWRTTLIAAVVIPIALLMSVVFMKLFHMSFNLMTLGGLAACIGVVIDDAIVMVENIVVHISRGRTPSDASTRAIVEMTPALIGSTLTPIMVFVPLVFLGGITAVFFRALAMTMVTALLASLLLAICFTPVLARLFLRRSNSEVTTQPLPDEPVNDGRVLSRVSRSYERALTWSLGHRAIVGVLSVLLLAASVAILLHLESGFLPEMDEGAFVLDYVMPPGTSLTETDRVLRHIESLLKDTPEVESYSRRTGAQLGLSIAEPNTGDFLVKLKRKRERPLDEVTKALRKQIVGTEPAIQIEIPRILEDLISDLAYSPRPIEIKIFHDNPEVFKEVAADVEKWLAKVKGVVDVVNERIEIGPAVNFRVDQDKAARAGFSVKDVAALEAVTLDGDLVGNMIRGKRAIGIRVRYPLEYRSSIRRLESLLLTSPTGQTVPLASIAHTEFEEAESEIHRDNLRDLSAVTARLEGRGLGSAIAEIRRRLFKEVNIPAGTEIEFGGTYQIQQESFLALTQVLVASVLLIFIILVCEFRSFSHPLAILAATILCGFGALLAIWVTGQTLNVSSFMGTIMVVGIVHKNGILMLDAEKSFTKQGYELRAAILQAGRRRLRPILMTALATIFGMLPLAIGVGSGAQLLQPLAIAVIGGVAVSMVLSLLITPVLFYTLRARGW